MKGRVETVWLESSGSSVSEDLAIGATVVPVGSTIDFSANGGTVKINGVVYEYSGKQSRVSVSGVRTEEVVFDTPIDIALFVDDQIFIEPPGIEKWCLVRFQNWNASDAAYVRIPHNMSAFFNVLGVRLPDLRESVEVDLVEGNYIITDVYGLEPTIDGGIITGDVTATEIATDGLPPATSPTPNLLAGIGSLFVTWDRITDNHDPVTYEVYIDDQLPVTPAVGTFVGSILEGTTGAYRVDGTGVPFLLDTDYYCVVVARDDDGASDPSPSAGPTRILKALNQDDIDALNAEMDNLNNVVLPAVNTDLNNLENSVNNINTVVIPGINADVTALEGDLENLNTVVIPGMDLDITALENDVNNLNVTIIPGLENDLQVANDELEALGSLGTDLVVNGTGSMEDNTNFSGWTYDKTIAPTGAVGAFVSADGVTGTKNIDRFIPVDPSKKYKFSFQAKQLDTTGRMYSGIQPIDAYGAAISPQMYMFTANTLTTLAVELVPGATTITLTDSANWYGTAAKPAGGSTHLRSVIWWDYVDQGGKAWPENTYSRNFSGSNYYADGGIVGNVITLAAPYAGPVRPVGTKLSNGSSGGTYMYGGAVNHIIPTEWTTYSDTITGFSPPGAGASMNAGWPAGVAQAKLIWLVNRNDAGASEPTSQHAIAMVSFSDASASQETIDSWTATGTVEIDGGMIVADSITTGHMTVNSINGDRILANTLHANKIVAGSITTDRMTANTIAGDRITTNTLSGDRVTTNTLDASKIVAGSITTDRMTANTISGDRITTNTLNADKIVTDSITASQIAASAITVSELAALSVNASKIVADSITADQIAANAIATSELAALSVNASKIVANTITASQIAATTITAAQIAGDTITATQIAANAITASELAANSVIAGKVAANAITAGTISATAIDGMTITGATLQTAATGKRVKISSAAVGSVQFYSGVAGEFAPGKLESFATTIGGSNASEMTLSAPQVGANTQAGTLKLWHTAYDSNVGDHKPGWELWGRDGSLKASQQIVHGSSSHYFRGPNGSGATGAFDVWSANIYLSGVLFHNGNPVLNNGDWQFPSMSAGWQNLGGGYTPASYKKVNGIVYLRGTIYGGSVGYAPFFLPSGMRPNYNMLFRNASSNVGTRTQVRTDGAVYIDNAIYNDFWCLDGICFPSDG